MTWRTIIIAITEEEADLLQVIAQDQRRQAKLQASFLLGKAIRREHQKLLKRPLNKETVE